MLLKSSIEMGNQVRMLERDAIAKEGVIFCWYALDFILRTRGTWTYILSLEGRDFKTKERKL